MKREEAEKKKQRRQREAMAEAGLSEHFVTTAGDLALKGRFWAPLEYLIRSQCLYAQTMPTLIGTLVEHKRLVRVKYLACLLTDTGPFVRCGEAHARHPGARRGRGAPLRPDRRAAGVG